MWILAAAPAVALVAAVLYCQFSGNDKAPFLVLTVLALNATLLVAFVAATFVSGTRRPQAWLQCGVAAAPLIYAAIVILLARMGWVDSLPLLGFR